MPTLHFDRRTRLTPESYIGGLPGFGPARSRVFDNSADDYLKVDNIGPGDADVTEASGGVWERLPSDRSEHDRSVKAIEAGSAGALDR